MVVNSSFQTAKLGERKGVNKYYPPDWTPDKGGLNKYHGTHALRERARKLHEGILIVRFEMPYNIWCNGCGNHIGMGVRYNAHKRKVGNYYTTPIYKFRMKCHLCDQYFEIQTDPKNCEYVILSGAKRKEERWDPAVTENVQTTDRDVKEKLITDAMYKLEHSIQDKQKAKKVAPTLNRLEEIRDTWKDDFAVNQLLRKKFRHEKKEINEKRAIDNDLKERASLPTDMQLVEEDEDDLRLAKKIKYGEGNDRPDQVRREKRLEIKQGSIFKGLNNQKNELAKKLAKKSQKSKGVLAVHDSSSWTFNSSKHSNSLGIISKKDKGIANMKQTEETKHSEDNSYVSLYVQNAMVSSGEKQDIISSKPLSTSSIHSMDSVSCPDVRTQTSASSGVKEEILLSKPELTSSIDSKDPVSSAHIRTQGLTEAGDKLSNRPSLVACYSDSSSSSESES